MANTYRYRYGETKPATAPVGSADVIEIGDMVGLSSGAVKNAADTAWNTNLATTQADFVATFLGVAMQQSASGSTDEIRIASDGVFEFTCAAATFHVGDLVGPAKQTGNLLESQKVVAVSTIATAIGRVWKEYASNTTTVLVKVSTVLATCAERA